MVANTLFNFNSKSQFEEMWMEFANIIATQTWKSLPDRIERPNMPDRSAGRGIPMSDREENKI